MYTTHSPTHTSATPATRSELMYVVIGGWGRSPSDPAPTTFHDAVALRASESVVDVKTKPFWLMEKFGIVRIRDRDGCVVSPPLKVAPWNRTCQTCGFVAQDARGLSSHVRNKCMVTDKKLEEPGAAWSAFFPPPDPFVPEDGETGPPPGKPGPSPSNLNQASKKFGTCQTFDFLKS